MTTDRWWDALDDDILAALAGGAMSPSDIGARLGLPEAAIVSCLAMLAREGRIRVRLVERA